MMLWGHWAHILRKAKMIGAHLFFLLIIFIIPSICTKRLLNQVNYQDLVPSNHICPKNLPWCTYKLLYFGVTLHWKLLWELQIDNFQVHSNSSHINYNMQPIRESPATELEYQYSLKSIFPSIPRKNVFVQGPRNFVQLGYP